MENTDIRRDSDFTNYHNFESQFLQAGRQIDIAENKELYEKLDAAGCISFYHYLNLLGLAKDPNLIILSPSHHYYYEAEELKVIRTLVNLKLLNDIKQLMDFFHNIFQILPFESYFIGCFLDKKDQSGFIQDSNNLQPKAERWGDLNENLTGSLFTFLDRLYSKIDLRTKRYLTNGTVTTLLEEAFLKVTDMTRLNGLTYFCAKKIQSTTMYEKSF
jgi:hypothetical protein